MFGQKRDSNVPASVGFGFGLTLLFWMFGGTFSRRTRRATDATWFSDGTQWVNQPYFSGRAPARRHLRAGWKRMCRRWGVVAVLGVTGYGTVTAPGVTRWVWVLVGSVLVGLLADRLYRGVRGWRHRREVVRPLHEALAPAVGLDPLITAPRAWLKVPRNYRDESAEVKVYLPTPAFAGPEDEEDSFRSKRSALRQSVEGITMEKLGLSGSEMRCSFSMTGRHPHATIRHLPPVPGKVTVDDVREALSKARETAPILGLTRDHGTVDIDLDSEAPHVMLSMGTGGGKSIVARGYAAQVLRNGGRVVVLDVKRKSQSWLKDHPHVRYARDAETINDELVALGDEVIRRQRISDEDDHAYVGPRILVIVEERNAMVEMVKAWWSENKPKGSSGQAPGLVSLNNVAFMGREPKIHLFSIAQYGDAKTMGGGAGRENFGGRILGRASRNAWRMLAPEVARIPSKTSKRGRFHVVVDESPVETQGIMWSTQEAREWAWGCFPEGLASQVSQPSQAAFYAGTGGGTVLGSPETETVPETAAEAVEPAEVDPVQPVAEGLSVNDVDAAFDDIVAGLTENIGEVEEMPESNLPPSEGETAAETTPDTTEETLRTLPDAMTLREAVKAGVVVLSDDEDKTLTVLRKAKQRDSEFPAPCQVKGNAHLFAPDDLARWARNRESNPAE